MAQGHQYHVLHSKICHSTEPPSNLSPRHLHLSPQKANPGCIRWTVGGHKIDYSYDVSTKTADLTTAKLLVNRLLSTKEHKVHGDRAQGFLFAHVHGALRVHANAHLDDS